MVPERSGYYSIILKETVNGRNYIYVEDRGHLIRLKCGDDVDFGALTLRDERGDTISYKMDYQWNRLTRTGTVSACEDTGVTVLGSTMDATFEGDSGQCAASLRLHHVSSISGTATTRTPTQSPKIWCSCVTSGIGLMIRMEPDPTGVNTRAILEVEDCINAEALDVDGDGEPEVAVRTRWPEKPYTVYDYADGEITEIMAGHPGRRRFVEQLRAPCGRRCEWRCTPMESCAHPRWELWVDPVRRMVSFHPEAGGQYLAFQSRELFLRCIDQYTAAAIPVPIGTKKGPGVFAAGPLSCTSKTVSRVLYSDSHLSRRTVAGTLQPPPRRRPGRPVCSPPRCCSG